jgi:Fungal Zn(2)-Cys(6) binuclear cluster domain
MSTAEDPAAAPPKGRAKACTACRQVKLKCDAKELYPNPCTRCKTQSLDCRMDPSFKRVPARRQLEEVSERLINLQRSLGLNEDSSLPSAAASVPNPPRFDRLSDQPEREPLRRSSTGQESSESFVQLETDLKFLDLDDEPREGQWTLGDVTLSYQEVLPLFEHFDSALSRHVPFLEPCNSLHRLYNSNDLLFWTIALTACRLYNQYDDLYRRLSPHHRTLMAIRTFGSRVTLETIHSLLLLCTWPYPVNSQHDDITWVLCGVAINLGMVIGLHKPNHGHEYVVNEDTPVAGSPFSRKMTWLACFQISTR